MGADGQAMAVVICTRDRPGLLADALAATVAALAPGDEVVVVDSASTDRTACAPAVALGIDVVRLERPGLSRARNAGVAATGAPLLAFTDDDCRPDPGWLAALRVPFAVDRSGSMTGFVTGAVLPVGEHKLTVSCVTDPVPRPIVAGADPFGAGAGANMAFRRSALAAAGGFDERLGAGSPMRAGEDSDLWLRLLDAGWNGAYVPDAVVRHVQWRNDVQAIRMAYGYGLGAGAVVAKAVRARHRGAFGMLWRRAVVEGGVQAVRDLATGYQSGFAACALAGAGTAVGFARAARWPAWPVAGDARSDAG